jgi:hypothetical protein
LLGPESDLDVCVHLGQFDTGDDVGRKGNILVQQVVHENAPRLEHLNDRAWRPKARRAQEMVYKRRGVTAAQRRSRPAADVRQNVIAEMPFVGAHRVESFLPFLLPLDYLRRVEGHVAARVGTTWPVLFVAVQRHLDQMGMRIIPLPERNASFLSEAIDITRLPPQPSSVIG